MEKQFSKPDLDNIYNHLSSVLRKPSDRITLPDTFQAMKDKVPGYIENVFISQLNKAIKDNKFPGLTIVRGRYGGIRLDKVGAAVTPKTKPLNEVTAADVPRELSAEDVASSQEETTDCAPEESEELPEVKIIPNEDLYEKVRAAVTLENNNFISTAPSSVERKVVPSWAKPQPKVADRVDLWIRDKQYKIPHTVSEIRNLLDNVLEVREDADGPIKFQEQGYICSDTSLEFLDKFLFFFYGAAISV